VYKYPDVSGPEPTDSGDVNGDSGGDDGTDDSDAGEPVLAPSRAAIADRLASYESVLEVGVGRRPGVAAALAAAGLDVTAVDVHDRPVPDSVQFLQDDIVERAATATESAGSDGDIESETAHYRVDAIYALNLPPELQQPTHTIARAVDAAFLFTTLGGDPATIPVRTELIGRETLYVARE
jgi:uncharacterized UPF0146 family protein